MTILDGFRDRRVADKYVVKMPAHLSAHDRWDTWERERFLNMESVLRYGDILFDIGAESGEISAIYAKFVGAENMVLMESAPEIWRTIKATWEANQLPDPLATFCGLVGEQAKPSSLKNESGWPKEAFAEGLWVDRTYRYLHEHDEPQTSVDVFVETTGIVPSAITIDVEGAEMPVLRGAIHVLKERQPNVWVSLHPDLSEQHYGVSTPEVHRFMCSLNYLPIHIATDHEEHYLYKPDLRLRRR